MRFLKVIGLSALLALGLTACGERVQIPPGSVGKQLTTSGLEEDIREPGSFRMESCMFSACPRLVKLETFENSVSTQGGYLIPKSNNISVDIEVVVRFRPKQDLESLNEIYNRVKPTQAGEYTTVSTITSDNIFRIFIAPSLRDTVRAALAPYTVEQLMANLGQVREFVESKVKQSLDGSPIQIMSLTFNTVNWPESVTTAIERTAQVEFEKITRLKQVQADIAVAQAERRLDIYRAQVDTEIDAIVSKFMGPRMALWRQLEVMATAAENGTAITIHPGLLPQNTFNFADDNEVRSYDSIPEPQAPTVDDLIDNGIDMPTQENAQ